MRASLALEGNRLFEGVSSARSFFADSSSSLRSTARQWALNGFERCGMITLPFGRFA
jgi:hypothetical protein